MPKLFAVLMIIFLSFSCAFAQQEETPINNETNIKNYKPQDDYYINSLAPAKAAFYSAILPGLGQAYNKKYWKIPIIYSAMGTSLYFYKRNNDNYNRVLDALKLELQGKPHEFDNLNVNALETAISGFKKDRDLYLFVTVGLYILNILEANVDAHLPDKKIDSNLSFKPNIFVSPNSAEVSFGASLTFKF